MQPSFQESHFKTIMPALPSPLAPLAVCLALASGILHAQDKNNPSDFVGLPSTGKVDDSQVVKARHGAAAADAAPGNASANASANAS
ncbi:MAG TPA: hypothetical protein DCX52_15265, partial [Massilia sp.]|nr:hypothetical protein [Massilia sp.]